MRINQPTRWAELGEGGDFEGKNKSTNNSYKSNQSQLIPGKGSKRSQPKSGNDSEMETELG